MSRDLPSPLAFPSSSGADFTLCVHRTATRLRGSQVGGAEGFTFHNDAMGGGDAAWMDTPGERVTGDAVPSNVRLDRLSVGCKADVKDCERTPKGVERREIARFDSGSRLQPAAETASSRYSSPAIAVAPRIVFNKAKNGGLAA